MAETLRMANETMAYTLSDRGTYLAQKERPELELLADGDPMLHNAYALMVVSAAKNPGVNEKGARRFVEFMRSTETLRTINNFGRERFGQSLFFVDE